MIGIWRVSIIVSICMAGVICLILDWTAIPCRSFYQAHRYITLHMLIDRMLILMVITFWGIDRIHIIVHAYIHITFTPSHYKVSKSVAIASDKVYGDMYISTVLRMCHYEATACRSL